MVCVEGYVMDDYLLYRVKFMHLPKTRAFGLFAAVCSVTIWAVFILSTRFAVKSNFTVEEVLILRLVPAAVFLAPLMLQLGVIPHGQPWHRAVVLMIGASAFSPFLISKGLSYANASDGGALAPGMLPFWTALAAYMITREVPNKWRRIGLAMILFGGLMVSLWQVLVDANEGAWKGHILFLAGSGCWAVYSVVFRQSGLSPMHGLVIGLFWGTLIFIPFLLITGNVRFADANLGEITVMIVLQGFIIGILAMILFNYAVHLLGAAEAAAFGALTPILALLGGIILLEETVAPLTFLGILLIAGGVFLASGFIKEVKLE